MCSFEFSISTVVFLNKRFVGGCIAPQFFVYDNCCNFLHYALYREPVFFKRLMAFIDRLHHDNHTNCSDGFDINRYEFLKDVNSQAAEQNNSDLSDLHTMASFLSYENFMLLGKIWVMTKNEEKNQKMQTLMHSDSQWQAKQQRFVNGCAQLRAD